MNSRHKTISTALRIAGWIQLSLLGMVLWLTFNHEAHAQLHSHGTTGHHCSGDAESHEEEAIEGGCVVDLFLQGKLCLDLFTSSRHHPNLLGVVVVAPVDLGPRLAPPAHLSPFSCGPP